VAYFKAAWAEHDRIAWGTPAEAYAERQRLAREEAESQCEWRDAPSAVGQLVLGCIVLNKAGLPKLDACQRIAIAVRETSLFSYPPTAGVLGYWVERLSPRLTPVGEAMMARAVDRCGTNIDSLANYFVSMAHNALNPAALGSKSAI
jgi:hypothetical protein